MNCAVFLSDSVSVMKELLNLALALMYNTSGRSALPNN